MSSSGTAGSPCLTLSSSNSCPSCLSTFGHHLLVSLPRVHLSGGRTVAAQACMSNQKAPHHGYVPSLPGGLLQRRPSGQQDLGRVAHLGLGTQLGTPSPTVVTLVCFYFSPFTQSLFQHLGLPCRSDLRSTPREAGGRSECFIFRLKESHEILQHIQILYNFSLLLTK